MVENAVAEDLDAIAAIEMTAFEAPWSRQLLAGELSEPGRHSLVARERRGEVSGYLFAMYLFEEMHINKVAVEGSRRRRGIALRLTESCIAFAKAKGIRTISLEVRESNFAAQALYRHLNFAARFRRRDYYPDGEAAVVMVLELE